MKYRIHQLFLFCIVYLSLLVLKDASFIDPKCVSNLVENSVNIQQIINQIKKFGEERKILPKSDRSIIIYHLNSTTTKQAFEVAINNLIIYTSSIKNDLGKDSTNFYLFNIQGGVSLNNFLIQYLPPPGPNVAWLSWKNENSSNANFLSLFLFKDQIVEYFYNFIFLSDKERGPFRLRNDGAWVISIQNQLKTKSIALFGSTIKCDTNPQILGLMSMPTTLINEISKNLFITRPGICNDNMEELKSLLFKYIQKKGYKIASEHYQQRNKVDYFNGKCLESEYQWSNPNPSTWCDLKSEDMNFFVWDENLLRKPGIICQIFERTMNSMLETLSNEEPNLGLFSPEVLGSGDLYSLYKDFQMEMQLNKPLIQAINEKDKNERHSSLRSVELKSEVSRKVPTNLPTNYNPQANHVCFAVRSSRNNDIPFYDEFEVVSSLKNFKRLLKHPIITGIQDLIISLFRQKDPHWKAYFFIADDSSFDNRLHRLLEMFNDPRLIFLPIPSQYRPPYNGTFAGYLATDYALSLIAKDQQCYLLSTTNSDNLYGSEVVQNIHKVKTSTNIELIVAPIDTRNFALHDYLYRRENTWDKRCEGINAMLNFHGMTYAAQTHPMLRKIDLSGGFLDRDKFIKENIYFSNFTNNPCKGCQDGYFYQYLFLNAHWKYYTLPIDGLKSLIFHGPSPTWCIASGNIWLDHPYVYLVNCYSRFAIEKLRYWDQNGKLFDWDNYEDNEHRCLRYSEYGYNKILKKNKGFFSFFQ